MTITYVIKVGENCKIGKTTNLNNRLKTYQTSIPNFHQSDILLTFMGDVETFLHIKFASKRIAKSEWFKLDDSDLEEMSRCLMSI